MQSAQHEPPLLDLHAVAARVNAGESTIRRWAREGKIPVVRLGRRLRFDPRDVEQFIADHRAERRA